MSASKDTFMTKQNIRHTTYKFQGEPNHKKTASRITALQHRKLYVTLQEMKTNNRDLYLIIHSIQRRKENGKIESSVS